MDRILQPLAERPDRLSAMAEMAVPAEVGALLARAARAELMVEVVEVAGPPAVQGATAAHMAAAAVAISAPPAMVELMVGTEATAILIIWLKTEL